MKRKFSKLVVLLAILFTVSAAATAQIYVRIHPPVPVIVRPPQPTQNHVWIEEDWSPNGKHYRYSGGRWATPPRRGYHRQPGHWKPTRRGDVWVQGRWSRN